MFEASFDALQDKQQEDSSTKNLAIYFLPAITCSRRALMSFLMSGSGNGFSSGNWIVPLDVVKPFSSSLNCSSTELVGKRLV